MENAGTPGDLRKDRGACGDRGGHAARPSPFACATITRSISALRAMRFEKMMASLACDRDIYRLAAEWIGHSSPGSAEFCLAAPQSVARHRSTRAFHRDGWFGGSSSHGTAIKFARARSGRPSGLRSKLNQRGRPNLPRAKSVSGIVRQFRRLPSSRNMISLRSSKPACEQTEHTGIRKALD